MTKAKSNVPASMRTVEEPLRLPDWLPLEAWEGFVDLRGVIAAPWSNTAARRIIIKLARLRDEGNDPGAVLD